jgi:hypothetical protein
MKTIKHLLISAIIILLTSTANAQCIASFLYFPASTNGFVPFVQNSNPGGGTITSFYWDFGDRTTDNQPDPTHGYTTSGIYNVKLAITTSTGCIDTFNSKCRVDLLNPPLIANFIRDSFDCDVAVVNCSTYPSSGITTFRYTFGDGGVFQTNSMNQTSSWNHTYSANGTYSVCLKITNGTNVYSICNTVVINNNCAGPSATNKINHSIKSLNVYPMPFANQCILQIESDKENNYSVYWINVLGEKIKSNNIQVTIGNNKIQTNVDFLPAGMYQLILTDSEGRTKSIKVIKE